MFEIIIFLLNASFLLACESDARLFVICRQDNTVPDEFGMKEGKHLFLQDRVSYVASWVNRMASLEEVHIDCPLMPCSNITKIANVTVNVKTCRGNKFLLKF